MYALVAGSEALCRTAILAADPDYSGQRPIQKKKELRGWGRILLASEPSRANRKFHSLAHLRALPPLVAGLWLREVSDREARKQRFERKEEKRGKKKRIIRQEMLSVEEGGRIASKRESACPNSKSLKQQPLSIEMIEGGG